MLRKKQQLVYAFLADKRKKKKKSKAKQNQTKPKTDSAHGHQRKIQDLFSRSLQFQFPTLQYLIKSSFHQDLPPF